MIADALPPPLGMLFALRFHAWPLAWRLGGWGVVSAVVAMAVHACGARAHGGDGPTRAAPDEAAVLTRIATAERRVAMLPGLRARAGTLARPGWPAPLGASATSASHGRDATLAMRRVGPEGGASAALLGWVEQSVLASRVRLLAFEPIAAAGAPSPWGVSASRADVAGAHDADVDGARIDGADVDGAGERAWGVDARGGDVPDAAASHRDATDTGLPGIDARGAAADAAIRNGATPTGPALASGPGPWRGQAARLRVEGHYPQVRDLLDRFARTRPALLIDTATLAAAGGKLSLTLRFWSLDAGGFTLRPASARRPGGAATPNPFARRRLPDATGAARLLGTLSAGRRRAALLALAQDTRFVEIGATVGDARVQAIGRDSATLAPLPDGAPRTLRLGE